MKTILNKAHLTTIATKSNHTATTIKSLKTNSTTTKTVSTKAKLTVLVKKSNNTATTAGMLKTSKTTAKTISTAITSNKTVNTTTPINKSANKTIMPDARSDTDDSGDYGEFFSKSWLDADAYCKDNSLGRLWGSDERFLTIDGRLLVLSRKFEI